MADPAAAATATDSEGMTAAGEHQLQNTGSTRRKSVIREEVEEVVAWLKEQGFGQYAEAFRKARITATEIPLLEDRHLKEMGIDKVGHRIKLKQAMSKFRRALKNYERNEVLAHFRQWYFQPSFLVLWPSYYDITNVALVVHVQHPLLCAVEHEVVDLSSIVDINLEELAGVLGYIQIISKDPIHPRLSLRLRLHKARKLFSLLRNVWDEDQLRVGAGIAAVR